MTDETTALDLRTWATLDAHGGKVSKRVEVLDGPVPSGGDGRYDGLVAVRGPHPLGVLDERSDGPDAVGWVDPAALRDWYRPDRVVVPLIEARRSGLEPGLYADTAARGRVRITGRDGMIGPDGRPAFRAVVGPVDAPVVDVPLPRDQVVRLVVVEDGATTDDGAAAVLVLSTPVSPFLAPGRYPDHSADVVGLPPREPSGTVVVRAFAVRDGQRHEVERIDERADTMWLRGADGGVVPLAASGFGSDLVRYEVSRG